MLGFLITVVKLLVILCIIATIHEFGHFIFSKLFKVGVNEFSIGFGPKIWQKKIGETMYSLRWIPLGGYCAIEGEEGASEKDNSITKKNIFQKVIIFMMGAGFNAILAFIIFFSLSFVAKTPTTVITNFSENSAIQNAGLQIGDKIESINGNKVKTYSEILSYSASYEDLNGVEIKYTRNGITNTVTVKDAVREVGYIGVTFNTVDENMEGVIDMVASGGAAFDAGLKAGDKVLSVNGITTNTSLEVISEIQTHKNEKIEMTIERNGNAIVKEISPNLRYSFDLGIASTEVVNTNLYYALVNTGNKFKTIVGSYIDLFRGKVTINDMSGIVGIGEMVSKSNTFIEFINLLAIISLAVGIANILPFPPLDGGKIVIAVIEAIVRKKLPEKAEMIISYIGFAVLIGITLIVTYRDIIRII